MARKRRSKSKRLRRSSIKHFFLSLLTLVVKAFPALCSIGAVLGIFLGIKQVLYADAQLQIRTIGVHPPLALSADQRRVLESKYIGKNLLTVPLQKIASDLEKDPEIRNAKVVRRFPSYLDIEIERREPLAYIRTSNKDPWGVIADDGVVLDLIKEPQTGILVMEAFFLEKSNLRPGYKIKHRGLTEAIRFAQAFWQHPLAQTHTLDKLSFDHLGNVSAQFNQGPEVRLGRSPKDRLGALEKVLQVIDSDQSKRIDYIDLQFENVIVKKKR